MASAPPIPAQLPQLQFFDSAAGPVPDYKAFVVELRKRAGIARAAKPLGVIDVLVTLGGEKMIMRLDPNLWCNQLGIPAAGGKVDWVMVPKDMERYPEGTFLISAKEWSKSFATAVAWIKAGGTKVSLGNAPYVLIFFVSEAARLEPARLQSQELRKAADASIGWQVVRPLLRNWSAISGKDVSSPTMGLAASACLDYAMNNPTGQKDFRAAADTVEWLKAMAMLETKGN